MSLKHWLILFKAQHERARAGTLSGGGLAEYRAGRDELARALLGAQAAASSRGRCRVRRCASPGRCRPTWSGASTGCAR